MSSTRPHSSSLRVRLGGLAACWLAMACSAARAEEAPAHKLRPPALRTLPVGAIRPEGWLKEQLRIQADGLTGHLDEMWPDVARSGWIGGNAEGWERLPYWMDGLVPLAFVLDDARLIDKVRRHLGYILEHQSEDGWLGPEKSATGKYQARDPWPVFIILKALAQYHEATADERVIPAMTRFFRRLDAQLAERPLFEWNRMRWQDGAMVVHWLHDRTAEPWLLGLAEKLHAQGYDWRKHFEDLPHKDKVSKWEHESHVVNNAQGVKAPGVWFRQSADPGDRRAASLAIEVLDRYHGQASGIFTGDECFSGRMPSQGTETCAVVEYMLSVSTLAAILGDPAFGDRLERIAFNALPAPFKPDMWARQYVQQANQAVARKSDPRIYTTNGSDANVFGFETNYGCCTANLHQGWPKLVTHLWMQAPDEGLVAMSYAPASISARVQGVTVKVRVETTYPFEETVRISVAPERPVRFPVHLRIPAWAHGATLSATGAPVAEVPAGELAPVDREWSGTTELVLKLPMRIRVERRFHDAIAVHRGPLVFSLAVGESWKVVGGTEPHADWEVHPTTPWNVGLLVDSKDPASSFEVISKALEGNPFTAEGAPVRLIAKGRVLPQWGLERNAAAPPPRSPVASTEELRPVTLVPYGAAKLRMTELPVLEE